MTEFYVAPDVARQLENGKKIVQEANEDRFYIIDGRESSGKSTLATQLATFIDSNFSVDQIVFTATDFENLIRTLPPYRALVFDEAFNGLSAKGSTTRENKELIRLMMECRQRNLFVFIVLPSIFLLEKYAAIFRSHALFHVYRSKGMVNRRYFKVYNYKKKKLLYIMGKQTMSYHKPYNSKSYRFYGKTPSNVDMKHYDSKKLAAFKRDKQDVYGNRRLTAQRDCLMQFLYKRHAITYREIADLLETSGFPLTPSVIGRAITAFAQDSVDSGSHILNPNSVEEAEAPQED